MASVAASVFPASPATGRRRGPPNASAQRLAPAWLPSRVEVSVAPNRCCIAADAPQVVVVGADHALFELLDEWLGQHGYRVCREAPGDDASRSAVDVVIVDAPFDDAAKAALLARIANEYARAPVLLLSSRLLAGVRGSGPVARALGVSTVLPKPVNRDTLVDAVVRLRPA